MSSYQFRRTASETMASWLNRDCASPTGPRLAPYQLAAHAALMNLATGIILILIRLFMFAIAGQPRYYRVF
ncbi:uncharacterized protein BDW70DRAFT_144442 [Aspergillus foveolatus]|uniref:uncharacterized protein n=1 Tax=Aspergillus foveolatus TaxID=210207 RepID=UPI003CCE2B2B